jgi:F420-non-reducing hydrogenase iron-sulfur subunit
MAEANNGFSPKIAAFCCFHSSYKAADTAGLMRSSYPESVYIIRVPCAGAVEGLHILRAFEEGADGVLIMACPEGACHSLSGNIRARKRVEHILPLLEEIGIEPERLRICNLASNQASRFVQVANEMAERIREIGPSPLNGADLGRCT